MVQNKHFKALVRARMARTGERYTTARQQILAARPAQAAESGLVPGYPQARLSTDAAASQYDAALWQRVLAQAGIENPLTGAPFSSAMLAGLAGGIGFMFATFVYRDITTATVVLRAHPEPYVDRLLERSGVTFSRTVTTSAKIAAATLDADLEAGRATVVRVTHGALPWVRSDELEHQGSIDVVVAGRDGEALLIDGGGWSPGEDEGEHLFRATPGELAEARRKRKADKHWAVTVDPDAPRPSAEQLLTNVKASIVETTGRLLGTLPLDGVPSSWLPKFGVQGMRTWADALRDERTKRGWPALFADQDRLRIGLQMVQDVAGGVRWGGRGGLRGLYADYLVEASELPGLAALAPAAAAYRELALRWDAFIDGVDPSTAVDERVTLFRSMADQLEDLAALEERAAHTLREALPIVKS